MAAREASDAKAEAEAEARRRAEADKAARDAEEAAKPKLEVCILLPVPGPFVEKGVGLGHLSALFKALR